jgi:hypothetical protein
MPQQLIDVDARGVGHFQSVLTEYLPGLDPGVTVLSDRRVLLRDEALQSLRLEYGEPAGILALAGVEGQRSISDVDALELLLDRRVVDLPARPEPAADERLWHLDATDVESAWQLWGGPLDISWNDVKVGQVDTGYTRHPAFGFPAGSWIDVAAAETFFAPGSGVGGPGPGKGVDPLEDLMDGHGTRIASVICGYDDQATGGLYTGVAPRVPLVPVRIANNVFISHAQRELAQALRYLVHDVRVSVINLSMGFLPRFQLKELDRAIDETYEAGVIFVCAAGQPLAAVVSPAHGRRTIAAAGSTKAGIPWGDSAHGKTVDWAAPAKNIFRAETKPGGATIYGGGGDGTSYAAAITTGAAALWLAHRGDEIRQEYAEPWQRIEAFKAVAEATAKPMPHQKPGSFGAGVLDVGRLVRRPLPPASSLAKDRPA